MLPRERLSSSQMRITTQTSLSWFKLTSTLIRIRWSTSVMDRLKEEPMNNILKLNTLIRPLRRPLTKKITILRKEVTRIRKLKRRLPQDSNRPPKFSSLRISFKKPVAPHAIVQRPSTPLRRTRIFQVFKRPICRPKGLPNWLSASASLAKTQ